MIAALEWAEGKRVNIYTDSAYVVGAIHVEMTQWIRSGFLTAAKTPIKHEKDMRRLREALMKPAQGAEDSEVEEEEEKEEEEESGQLLVQGADDREVEEEEKVPVPVTEEVAEEAEDEERIQGIQNDRRVQTEAFIQQMREVKLRLLATQLFSREPGLVFDALEIFRDTPTPPPAAALPWCTCGNCREMATYAERKCCGQGPIHCISQLPHFTLYCLDLHRRHRNDVLVDGDAREPGEDRREYRYAAYRQYIFWQHGSLGQGNRCVIPSCWVWRTRDKYPDPQGQYTGFMPTI
uniref:uncharacterized protein LOC117263021 n=1 Tax=Epinephelus lanceolatus TaxID=310571 RepID=UPI0014456751|nr:uncharacterized protein LOC117263021 [Epinephelus lanceolatus]